MNPILSNFIQLMHAILSNFLANYVFFHPFHPWVTVNVTRGFNGDLRVNVTQGLNGDLRVRM